MYCSRGKQRLTAQEEAMKQKLKQLITENYKEPAGKLSPAKISNNKACWVQS